MSQDWKVRVQPAERAPYEFSATLLLRGAGDASALDVSYLYGDGDLAVYLEDLGARVPEICGLLERLRACKSAEIVVEVSDEAMEVLARRRPGARS